MTLFRQCGCQLRAHVESSVPFFALCRQYAVVENVTQASQASREGVVGTLEQERALPSEESSRLSSAENQPIASTSKLVSGEVRLVSKTLPVPHFTGKRRPPIDVWEAIAEVKAGTKCKFDETVELVLRLGTDPRRGDQQVRGSVLLPHGTGKSFRVCVFAEGEAALVAQDAGADLVGSDDILEKVKEGEIEFDKCLSTSDMMPRLSKVARVLGPRGLMPNPKLGTLVGISDLPTAIKQLKGGRVEYRADRTANVHSGIGKASFPPDHLYRNLGVFASAILNARPKGLKGSGVMGYILAAHMTSTMGRGIPVTVPSVVTAIQKAKR